MEKQQIIDVVKEIRAIKMDEWSTDLTLKALTIVELREIKKLLLEMREETK